MSDGTPLDCVLAFIRTIEAGGTAEDLEPFLADGFKLTEWPHALAKLGSTRNRSQILDGVEQGRNVVADQHFEVIRSTCEGQRVVLEIDWSATILLDLPYWDAGERIRARTTSVFELRDGKIVSQDSYDCYFTEAEQP
jgi:ketosteroid isomerase-like protein